MRQVDSYLTLAYHLFYEQELHLLFTMHQETDPDLSNGRFENYI